jgi:hypothetical protein
VRPMREQQLRYRYRENRTTLLREVCHRVGRQTPEEQVVVVEAEVDRQDHQDHQEDHRRSRDYLQGSERKGRMAGMRESTRSYWNDRWRSRDT